MNCLQRIKFRVLPFQDALRFFIIRICGITSFDARLNVTLGVVNVETIGQSDLRHSQAFLEEADDTRFLIEQAVQ